MRSIWGLSALLATMVIVAPACVFRVDESSTPSTITAAPTRSADPEASTSTADAEASSHILAFYGPAGPLGPIKEGDADGSGCTPDADVLADGFWFGEIEAAAGDEISFDLWCRFSGERAFDRDDYLGGDHVYQNNNTVLRQVPVAQGAVFWFLVDTADPDSQAPLGLEDVSPILGSGRSVWIWVEQGAIVDAWEPWDS